MFSLFLTYHAFYTHTRKTTLTFNSDHSFLFYFYPFGFYEEENFEILKFTRNGNKKAWHVDDFFVIRSSLVSSRRLVYCLVYCLVFLLARPTFTSLFCAAFCLFFICNKHFEKSEQDVFAACLIDSDE